MEITSLKIDGLTSEACATKLAEALSAQAGVEKASVSFANQQANINFNPEQVSKDQLEDLVAATGFAVQPPHGEAGNCCGSCT